ncbi:MAG: phosphopantetheine-binding protein [Eubacterium sp.]|nr:phosphopantetheine-binding protein [Eubacterium sp.]
MKIQDVKKKIIEVIKESTETEITLTSETELFADMGLSSVEVVVMLGDLEDAFGIDIPAVDIRNVRTIGELSDLIIFILKGDKTPTSIGGEL